VSTETPRIPIPSVNESHQTILVTVPIVVGAVHTAPVPVPTPTSIANKLTVWKREETDANWSPPNRELDANWLPLSKRTEEVDVSWNWPTPTRRRKRA